MKKSILFIAALFLFTSSMFAQNSVQLNIHHKLANNSFAMETAAVNNISNDFEVTRLQYYISEISIIHDGGAETIMEDLYVLVDAGEATQVDLGDFDITSVEMVKFHLGVDEATNHLDPSSYSPNHPLAPQSPSMHWGWAAGYRFVAIEGFGGANYNQLFQLHGLGDNNYFLTEIPVTVEAENNEVVIDLDADYTRALENITVNNGLIVHGDYAEAQKCLENFRDYVFSQSSETTSSFDLSEVNQFDIYPNPAPNGLFNIEFDAPSNLEYEIIITDILGKQIAHIDAVKGNSTYVFQLKDAGLFFINLIKEGQPVISKKLISK